MSKIIQHTANGSTFLIVEVDRDATYFLVVGNIFSYNYETNNWIDKLPPGNYQFLFIAEEATPEQAEEVADAGIFDYADEQYTGYMDYLDEFNVFTSSTDSLTSLTRLHFPNTFSTHKRVILKAI